MQRVCGFLLNNLVDDVKKLVESYHAIWKHTGCTIMADGWTDRCRRTLINFLVYCPKGTIFLKSVDASQHSKTAELLYKLFRDVVLFVGAENVVHIVTDNAANYVAAGKLLEAEFPKLYWSPCAAHCVNLMLQDIGKFEDEHTGGREILRPAPTRFATNFIALQSILAQKDALRAMVTSKEWTSSTYAKDVKAKRFVDQVLDSGFWDKCVGIVKLTEPLIRFLRLLDSEDKPSMGSLYQAFFQTRDDMLRRNLHAAGYWLNPACQFNLPEFVKHENTKNGLFDVFERYAYGDHELERKLSSEMRIYKDAELDFVRPLAVRERNTINGGNLLDVDVKESPPFLTIEEVEALRKDLSNMNIQPNFDDIDQLNLDDNIDDVAQYTTMENENAQVGEDPTLFDEDVHQLDELDATLPPWT
ncbi:uncharacterized protein LOC130743826 [Lotus japonicus]|uniref:uncharacterized protein LOC130743826 n=1 Tax=Lotus japonicus TaxID=34305 RepID=UPI002586C74B|nr:uncharacterized protein LOC130743826 [Lotus japonicus]